MRNIIRRLFILLCFIGLSYLGKTQCSIRIEKVTTSGCYFYNGGSYCTVSVQVGWTNVTAGNNITVTLGSQTTTILAEQTPYVTKLVTPQVVAFEVPSNNASGTITASNSCGTVTGSYTTPSPCQTLVCPSGNMGGKVFVDYNADGIQQPGETKGEAGISVTIFDVNGTTYTTTSDVDGLWSINVPAAKYPVRLELTNIPAYLRRTETQQGGSSVQFYSAPNCNTTMGVLNAYDFAQTNPDIYVPIYVNGDPQNSSLANSKSIVKLPYNFGTGNYGSQNPCGLNGPLNQYSANVSQTGSLWAAAYNKYRKELYTAAVLKRHVGLGPQGLGGIYKTDVTTNTTSNLFDITSLGVNIGQSTVLSNSARGLSGINTLTHDPTTFGQVGKVGLGGMSLSEDGSTMYVVNLYQRTLLAIKLDQDGNPATPPTAADVTTYQIPVGSCTNGQARPWACKVYQGKVYVGVVCDGSISNNKSDMTGTVYQLNVSTGVFTAVFDFPLTYPKGTPAGGPSGWYPWTDDYAVAPSVSGAYIQYATPILADLAFDIDGSIVISFADRATFQWGNDQYGPDVNSTTSYYVFTAGDILRAYKYGDTYVLENGGKAGPNTGFSTNNNQGPGFGEFYDDNTFYGGGLAHSENMVGGIAIRPGSGEVVSANMDSWDAAYTRQVNAFGLRKNSNITGSNTANYLIASCARNLTDGLFAKGGTMGDLELATDLVSYNEIGNRIWIDTDKDGIQDPNETALSGVSVQLRDANGSVLATTTTDTNGNYYFTTGVNGLTITPKATYYVTINPSQFSNGILTVSGTQYNLTRAFTGQGANPTLNDNNGTISSGAEAGGAINNMVFAKVAGPTISTTNHTIDFGFYPYVPGPINCLGVAIQNVTCNGLNDGRATAQVNGGTAPYTYLWNTAATTNSISNLSIGTYTVTIRDANGTTATCSGTITQPTPLTVNFTKIDIKSCDVFPTGKAWVSYTGATAPYDVIWSNLATTDTISGLSIGNYTVNVTDANGCAYDNNFTINKPTSLTINVSATTINCPGGQSTVTVSSSGGKAPVSGAGTFTVNPGTYTYTVTDAEGCSKSSTITVNAALYGPTSSTTNVSVCPSQLPYVWNGQSITTTGSYTFNATNSKGCDSVATLNLTVKANTTSITNVSVCPSQLPYLWNGVNRTTSGSYTFNTTNSKGCDSVATLNLTVKTNTTSTTNVSVCPSQLPYLWNGVNRTTTGAYTYSTTNSQGCDSVATLNLTVKTNTTSTTNLSICPSQLPYNWNGINRNAAGTYTFTTTNSQGCDSVATLNLTVKTNTASTTNISICPSQLPYNWNGINRNAAGTYTFNTTNSQGCDSVATLNLTIKTNTASATNVSVCPSQLPYLWNGVNRTTTGTYTYTTTNSQGCDSVATLNLTVKTNTASATNVSICPSQLPYLWNGVNRTITGTYTYTTTNSQGCDSVATLNLTVKTNTASTTNVSVCPSELPYLWNGVNRTITGTYTYATTNSQGCDSVATLNLIVKTNTTSTTSTYICNSALPFIWNGRAYYASATDTVHLTNNQGCDSATILKLVVQTPNCNLQASYTISQAAQCVTGNSFSFTSTVTGNTGLLTYLWNFGDGTTSTLANPTHTYAIAGEYDVTLIVTEANACIGSCTAYASAKQVYVGPKPTVAWDFQYNGNCLTYDFNSNSKVTMGWITGFYWDFGNGQTSTQSNPLATFSAAGTYNVKLVVTTNYGCKDSLTIPVSIVNKCNTPVTCTPVPTITTTGYNVCNGDSVKLVAYRAQPGLATYTYWYKDGIEIANHIDSIYVKAAGNYYSTTQLYQGNGSACYSAASSSIYIGNNCSVTSGSYGGVESKTLGDVIAVRLYGNSVNSVASTNGYNNSIKFNNSGVIVNGAKDLTLNALVPATVANTDAAYVTTPTDLVNFTNAVEVLAVDYAKGSATKAVAFGTKTLGDVYSHTKPICDRLKGAELMEVKNITVNGFNLMAYKVHQRTGETEYAMNLSAGTATNRSSISLQSNWFTDSYQQDEKLYNFQLWAVSYEMVTAMATDIISKLQANGTVNTVTNADLPKAYISKGSRKATDLTVTVQNNTSATTGYFELQEKVNENSQVSTRQIPFTVNANGTSNISIPVKDNYEGNIYVYLNNKLTDLVYLSDGTWSLDYNKNTTTIQQFNVTNETPNNLTPNSSEYRLFRNVAVSGVSKDYITVYKTMMGGGLEQNVSAFKSIFFNANATGAGSVKVTLIKKSITNWDDQYSYTVGLNGDKEYGINLSQFTSAKYTQAINANDITAVNFNFINSRGVPTTMTINLSKVRFASGTIASDISVNTMGVYPNPTMGKFTTSFTSATAQSLVLKVTEASTGRIVKTQFINAAKGNNQIVVDNNLANGLYIITLEGDDVKYSPAKLMVGKK